MTSDWTQQDMHIENTNLIAVVQWYCSPHWVTKDLRFDRTLFVTAPTWPNGCNTLVAYQYYRYSCSAGPDHWAVVMSEWNALGLTLSELIWCCSERLIMCSEEAREKDNHHKFNNLIAYTRILEYLLVKTIPLMA